MKEFDKTANREQERFIEDIIRPHCESDALVKAFRQVDRADFVPPEARHLAYTDKVVPLGDSSSISEPGLVAGMITLLDVQPQDTVLEVGTATGYQASVLAKAAKEVHTIELNPDLSERAGQTITRLGYSNITLHTGDGAKGVPSMTFDKIIITAAVTEIPPDLISQLNTNGTIVAPIGGNPKNCILYKAVKQPDGTLEFTRDTGCGFVPLYSKEQGGWEHKTIRQMHKDAIIQYGGTTRKYLDLLMAGTGETYESVMHNLASKLLLLLPDKEHGAEPSTLHITSAVLALITYLQETDHQLSDEAIDRQLALDISILLDKTEPLDLHTTGKILDTVVEVFEDLTKKREASFD